MKRITTFICNSAGQGLLFTHSLCFVFLFCPFLQQAQNHDTLQLKEVSILPRYLNLSDIQNLRKADSMKMHFFFAMNLGQFLQSENTVHVKTYGVSGSASSSVRGGNSSQTAVLWNGLNIRNPMLGENDLSLISMFLLDEVNVQLGGSTAMWGNASVSGAIHLRNALHFNEGLLAGTFFSIGSFGQSASGTKVSFSNSCFSTSSRFILQQAENNFLFKDQNGNKVKMSNARLSQFGLIHEDHWKVNTRNLLSFRYWTQRCQRQIPPALYQYSSKASQQDNFNRFLLEWHYSKNHIRTFFRQGLFVDQLNFSDSLMSIQSNSSALTSVSEFEFNFQPDKIQNLIVGVNSTSCAAQSDAYLNKVSQHYFSVFGSYSLNGFSGRNIFSFNCRQEYTLGKFQPFTYSFSDRFMVKKWLALKAGFSRLYRLPTFNNLYWNPGGNPELLPEEGFGGDLSLEMKLNFCIKQLQFVQLQSTLGLFTRNISNWIIWLPNSGGIWSPQNLMRVWSRGVESYSVLDYHFKKIKYRITLQTNYILSTNQQSYFEKDESLGRQLIYTPLYSGSASFQVQSGKLYFLITHSYTGYRYITSDNYNYLSPFSLTNAVAGIQLAVRKYTIDLNFACNNVFNSEYQMVAQRPMPLANYQVNFKVNYKNKN